MEKMNGKTMDIVGNNIEKLKEIFPDVFSEGKIDFEALKANLGEAIETEQERYSFNWNGKQETKLIAQTPSTGTLRPCKEDSKDWDTTENLYIEGDNLEVLKLLQKSYHNKVKMIYIDPPYNTGKDFVYKDNFKDNIKNYMEQTGQVDTDGNKLTTNSDQSGRYHSNWLNMMYPRLKLARNLLKDDGVIFISIDDNEVDNLKKICDEIFGEDNCIGPIIQNKQNAKNDTINIQKNHEHILVYRKSTISVDGKNIKPTIINIKEKIKPVFKENEEYYFINDSITTRGEGGTLNARLNLGYTVYYNKETKEKIGISDYDKELAKTSNEESEVYKTNEEMLKKGFFPIRPPKVRGKLGCWTWSIEKFNQNSKEILITGKNENYAVKKRTFVDSNLVRIVDGKNVFITKTNGNSRSILDFSTNNGTNALNETLKIEGVFNNPKNLEMLEYFIKLIQDKEAYILDFFSGSATTAHAVMKLNVEDEGNRKYIMVQLPEKTNNEDFPTICEIGKERIRRAGEKIKEELTIDNVQLKMGEEKKEIPDIGFKVFKLDSSNIKEWDSEYAKDNITQSLFDHVDNIKSDRTEEDILFELLLKHGLDLTTPINEIKTEEKKIFNIGAGTLYICLANEVNISVAERILEEHKTLESPRVSVIFKDTGFVNDIEKTNVIQTLKVAGITDVKSV